MQRLAETSSLTYTRLFPKSPIIQLVAVDGVVIGRVRRDGSRWIASGTGQRGPGEDCGTFDAAIQVLEA